MSNKEKLDQLHLHLGRANNGLKIVVKTCSRYPTKSNQSYAFGYLQGALEGNLIAKEDHTYWLAFFGLVLECELLRNEILQTKLI